MKLLVAVLLVFVAFVRADSDDDFLAEVTKRIPNNMWKAKKVNVTEERLRRPMGWLKKPTKSRRMRPGIDLQDILDNYEPPASFDAREKWDQCQSIKKIWDQSKCGSCYAFATTNSMSDRLCIHKDKHFLVSPEDGLSCCTYFDDFKRPCGTCSNGGYMEYVLDYFVNHGYCSGGAYGESGTCKPYSISPAALTLQPTPECTDECSDKSYEISFNNDIVNGSREHYYVPPIEKAIMEEIEMNGPVSSGLQTYTDFFSYDGGVYEHSWGDLEGGHAIRIIGWGTENDTPYWLIANSWSESWGEGGYFKILRGSNHCEIEEHVTTALP